MPSVYRLRHHYWPTYKVKVSLSFQGRVFFDIPLSKVEEVLKLRCVDNIWVLIGVWPKVDFDLKETPQVWASLAGAVTPY